MYDQKKERNFCLSHKHTSWKDTEQNIPRVRDWLEDVISSAQVMPTSVIQSTAQTRWGQIAEWKHFFPPHFNFFQYCIP